MMWFFAILIVLAMGGIALMAAGKGAPLSEAYDDRPDATVPATGPLSAPDLRRVRFSIALRGYRMSEVDALLDRLAGQLETPVEPFEHHAEELAQQPPEQALERDADDDGGPR